MLSAREFARQAGVSQATILSEIAAGRIAAARDGGRWRIAESEVARWQALPRDPAGRPAASVEVALSAETRRQLRTLALAGGVAPAQLAAGLLAAAVAAEWELMDAAYRQAAEAAWEGEVL